MSNLPRVPSIQSEEEAKAFLWELWRYISYVLEKEEKLLSTQLKKINDKNLPPALKEQIEIIYAAFLKKTQIQNHHFMLAMKKVIDVGRRAHHSGEMSLGLGQHFFKPTRHAKDFDVIAYFAIFKQEPHEIYDKIKTDLIDKKKNKP